MGLDLLIDVREGFVTVWTWNIPQLFYGSPVTFIHGILMVDRLITHVCNRRVPQFTSSSGGTQNNEVYNLIILRSQILWKHRVLPNYFRSLQPATPSTANLAMPSRAHWQRDVRKQYEHLIVKKIYIVGWIRMATNKECLLRTSLFRRGLCGSTGCQEVGLEMGNDLLDDEILRMHSLLKVAKKKET